MTLTGGPSASWGRSVPGGSDSPTLLLATWPKGLAAVAQAPGSSTECRDCLMHAQPIPARMWEPHRNRTGTGSGKATGEMGREGNAGTNRDRVRGKPPLLRSRPLPPPGPERRESWVSS